MARPRTHPEGTSAAEMVKASVAARLAAGSRRKVLILSPRAIESLALIRETAGDRSDTALIERLIESERTPLG